MTKTIPEMQHAKLGPSSASRWLRCTASLQYPQGGSNEFAARGTVIHEMGAEILQKGKTRFKKGDVITIDGFDVKVDDEMLLEAQEYVEYVKSKIKPGSIVRVEQTVKLNDDIWGTGDLSIYDPREHILIIGDLKTGRINVEAKGNEQLMLYALATIKTFKIDKDKLKSVELCIFQKNTFQDEPYKEWTCTPDRLKRFVDNVLTPVYREIKAEKWTYSPSEKACLWCSHAGECVALAESNTTVIGGLFSKHLKPAKSKALPLPGNLSTEDLEKIVLGKDLVTKWIKRVEETLLNRALEGETLASFDVGESVKHKRFRDEKIVESVLGEDAFKKSLVTPNQALTLVKGDKKKTDILNGNVYEPQGSPVLIKKGTGKKSKTVKKSDFKKYITK